jgi:integrase
MLTAKRVDRLRKKPGRYLDQRGLYLQIGENRNGSWILRYERSGHERMLGLGSIHDFSLKEARELAREARQKLAKGIDPIQAKREDRAAKALELAKTVTFESAAQQYHDQHKGKWKPRHALQFANSLKEYAFPKIGKLSCAAIDTGLVLKCIEPIWNTKTETASRVRGRIEAVLDWATVRGYRTGDNPARWKGHLSNVLPARGEIQKTKHYPALPYSQIPVFMAALRSREGTAARALEFLILTAARSSEVTGALWPEIDLGSKLWTVPAGRIKGGKEHKVPLSDRALAILKGLPDEKEKGNPFIFMGTRKGLSNMSMPVLLRRMNYQNITVHGFRSTFRTWAAEMTGYPNHVVEMALAHVIGSKVERSYQRGALLDKRRRLMAEWSKYCSGPTITGEVVVQLKRGR